MMNTMVMTKDEDDEEEEENDDERRRPRRIKEWNNRWSRYVARGSAC